MVFWDKVKKLFRREQVSVEDIKKLTGEASEEKEETSVVEHTTNNTELSELLNSISINLEYLALDRLQSESETISSYVKALLKDLSAYQDFKNEKNKVEDAIRGIGGKIRVIAVHCLELKNLLGNLEEHYYNPILDVLKKVNEKLNKEEMTKLISKIEADLDLVKELDAQITRIGGYDALFNSAKNPQYKDEIEKEVTKRMIHGELNGLLDTILVATTDRYLGLKNKIEKSNPLEYAKKFL